MAQDVTTRVGSNFGNLTLRGKAQVSYNIHTETMTVDLVADERTVVRIYEKPWPLGKAMKTLVKIYGTRLSKAAPANEWD